MKKINVVLYHPEIPQNAGNIMRSCVAFDAKLHLIRPYGFNINDKELKRSGLDYLKYLELEEYDDFDDFLSKNKGNFYFLTRYGNKTPKDIKWNETENNIYLFFGAESVGIAYDILKKYPNNLFRIPITKNVRSINLANTVAIMLYEASINIPNQNLSIYEPEEFKGKNFIEEVDLNTLDYKHKEWI